MGAGLAGLAAALELRASGHECLALEASDGPGGRVRSHLVDGLRLDRGFQILLTGYPALRRHFPDGPLDELDLRAFSAGAYVQVGSRPPPVAARRDDATGIGSPTSGTLATSARAPHGVRRPQPGGGRCASTP